MLPTQLEKPPKGPDWTFEVKFDGVRAFANVDRGVLTLVSRRGTPMTSWFPELAPLADLIGEADVVLDGEINIGSGSLDLFNALLRRVRSRGRSPADRPVKFVAFDVVAVGRVYLHHIELRVRRHRRNKTVTEGDRLACRRVRRRSRASPSIACAAAIR